MAKKPTRKTQKEPLEETVKDLTYDPLFTSPRAAKYLGYSYAAFRRMRSEEGGPKFIILGKRDKRYQLSDLNAWKRMKDKETQEEEQKIMKATEFVYCLRPSYVRKQKMLRILNKIKGFTKSFYFDLAVVIMLALALIFKLV